MQLEVLGRIGCLQPITAIHTKSISTIVQETQVNVYFKISAKT